jgi:hypothetical protein
MPTVRTDHFQTIGSRSVASKYQSCGLDRPLNDGNLEDSNFLCLSGRRGSEPWLGDLSDPQEKVLFVLLFHNHAS